MLAAVAIVVAIVYFGPKLMNGSSTAGPDTAAGTSTAYPTHSLASGPAATTTATADPAGPYARTPAATWAEGEAGIELPVASDVDGFPATEIDAALQRVRAVMVAARLDRRTIVDHDVSGVLDLLAPASRTQIEEQIRAGTTASLMLVTFVPDGARLDDRLPRVSGRTSFATNTDPDGRPVLEVVTNYVWAYAFASNHVVILHDELRWHFYRPNQTRDIDRGPWIAHYQGYGWGIDCTAFKQGLLAPPTRLQTLTTGGPTENPDALYAPDHSLEITATCPT